MGMKGSVQDPKVMGLNPSWDKLEVCSPSVSVGLQQSIMLCVLILQLNKQNYSLLQEAHKCSTYQSQDFQYGTHQSHCSWLESQLQVLQYNNTSNSINRITTYFPNNDCIYMWMIISMQWELTLEVMNFWKFTSYCSLKAYGRAWET